ncbi:MAG: hypothetical protein HY314_13680 [Acidobacteria bacterium]|nr:hypothetical protein [Acidobacteriota bacterium]
MMKIKDVNTGESVIRETLIKLLEDFREHAEVVLKAQRDVEAAEVGSDRFDRAIAKLDAALTALEVTVPALLRELDELDEIPEGE